MLADYERLRDHFGGVAVARLEGRRCSGCHLDLSTSEFEQLVATRDGRAPRAIVLAESARSAVPAIAACPAP